MERIKAALPAINSADDERNPPRARGVALGTACHGIATARAFGEIEMTGCAASLAMGLNALLTAVLVPRILVGMQIAR